MKTPKVADVRRLLTSPVQRLLQGLVLRHTRRTGIALLAAGLLLAVWLVVQVFFVEGATAPSPQLERKLSTSLIDRLELWIETVEDQRQAGLPLPARPLFVVDDPVPQE